MSCQCVFNSRTLFLLSIQFRSMLSSLLLGTQQQIHGYIIQCVLWNTSSLEFFVLFMYLVVANQGGISPDCTKLCSQATWLQKVLRLVESKQAQYFSTKEPNYESIWGVGKRLVVTTALASMKTSLWYQASCCWQMFMGLDIQALKEAFCNISEELLVTVLICWRRGVV
jgi:hypothetical protein